MNASVPATLGIFGKIPALGDFVRRRLSANFIDPWDEWLRFAVAQSKADLGQSWLARYLTSPLWRFALSTGVCGEVPAAGVLMPSVDAVNRHYPLTIAATLPETANAFALVAGAEEWFDAVEGLALSCLQPGCAVSSIDAQLETIGMPQLQETGASRVVSSLSAFSADSERWQVDVDGEGTLGRVLLPRLLDRFTKDRYAAYSLWWTSGSDDVPPSFLIYRGLPPPSDFAAMMCDRPALLPEVDLFAPEVAETGKVRS